MTILRNKVSRTDYLQDREQSYKQLFYNRII